MKDIEAVIPQPNVHPAIAQLQQLGVQEIIVEPIKVYRSDIHQRMIHRGCAYEQNFVFESKLRFHVEDQDATRAENILTHAGNH